jgi:hypothetical protein
MMCEAMNPVAPVTSTNGEGTSISSSGEGIESG